MILYCPQPTPRLAYMAHWLGMRLLGQPLRIISDIEALPEEGFVLNYSQDPLIHPHYRIIPHGLLHQQGIIRQTIAVKQQGSLPVFFATSGGDHAFDVLAASFYLLQRYEEYDVEFEKDEYGRYSHRNSIAWQHAFLKRPIVDEWIADLKNKLVDRFPGIRFVESKASVLATCDVDIAWSYRNKGLLRNIGGHFNDFRNKRWRQLLERWLVLAGFKRDPFEILLEMEEAHQYHHIPSLYFFLVAAKNQGYDKNISPRSKNLQRLIRWINEDSAVGIHFSWAASQDQQVMQSEKQYLENVLQQPVLRNRMHYVNFRLPDTYRQLVALGIREDYSMGYGTINGFRAGTSHPYAWYDLVKEEATPLMIYPFAWMDANSIFEQKDAPDAAYAEWMQLFEPVKATGGTFITICHNHLMGRDAQGQPWWLMYHRALKACGHISPETEEE